MMIMIFANVIVKTKVVPSSQIKGWCHHPIERTHRHTTLTTISQENLS